MSLLEYGRIIARRGWIMILLAVLAAGAAYILSTQITPVYRSTQRILLVPTRADFGLAEATTRLLNSHRAYLDSELRARDIIDALQLDMLPSELKSNVTITTDRDSLAIQIDVDLEDPDLANDIARLWGDLLVQYRNDLNQRALREDRIEASRQDDARASLLRPNLRINAIAGGIAGFFVGAILIFILEFLESNTIRRREDVERLGISVLSAVPD